MKKQNKRIIWIFSFIVAILFISLIAGGLFKGEVFGKKFFVIGDVYAGDMTINSISKTTINGKDGIRLYVTVNAGGELADITFSQDQLNQVLKSNTDTAKYSATKGIAGDMKYLEQSAFYPITSKNGYEGGLDYIFKSFRIVDGGLVGTCDATHLCSGKTQSEEELLAWRRPYKVVLGIPVIEDCLCLIGKDQARVKKFQGATESYYRVSFSIDGFGFVELNKDVRSGFIGNVAFIKWNGDLLSDVEFRAPVDDVFLNQYNLIMQEQGVADKILQYAKDAKYTYGAGNDAGCGNFETGLQCYQRKLDAINSNINSLWQSNYLDSWKTGVLNGNLIEDAVFQTKNTGSGLTVKFARPTRYPTFTIDLDAQAVGIVKLVGKPSFSLVSSCEFNSNALGFIDTKIKNTGTQTGSFAIGFENCNKISGVAMQLGTFTPSQEKSVKINIQGSTGSETSYGTCNLYVYDINDPINSKVNYNLNCKINPDSGGKCTEGQTKCDFNFENIQTCKNGIFVNTLACESGCTYDLNAKAICKGNGTVRPIECKTCEAWATNIFKKSSDKCESGNIIETKWYLPQTWIINGLGLAKQSVLCPIFFALIFFIFLFSLLFGKDIFGRFSAISDKPWLLWSINFIVALVIAWVTYMAFLIGILMLIIYIIFRMLIGGTIGKTVGAVRALRK